MIGMNNLGNNGRLGNQMFQYASLVGVAKKRNFGWCIPEKQDLSKGFELKNLKHFGYINGSELILHESHEFCEELMYECPDEVTFNGYFQSEKYFKHVEDTIREDFTFKDFILDSVLADFSLDLLRDSVSIVVRRYEDSFDYPGCDRNHRNLPVEYYSEAIKYFGKDRKYIICSNNIEWCKSQEIFYGDNFIFNEKTKGPFYDLCLTSLCKDYIISNSTFSWWGAWLGNRNKKVLSPSTWYGPGLSHINTDDLFPSEWVKIDL